MSTLALAAVIIVAIEHFAFLVIEMFFWTRPLGRRIFKQTLEKSRQTKVLAANQGLYNGILATGLLWSLLHPDHEFGAQLTLFFLLAVIVAGLYGAYSAHKNILFVQALPAAITLVLLYI